MIYKGVVLRAARKEFGLSQRRLAEQLNVSHQLVSQWEKGTVAPSEEANEQMAKVFTGFTMPTSASLAGWNASPQLLELIAATAALVDVSVRTQIAESRISRGVLAVANALRPVVDALPQEDFERIVAASAEIGRKIEQK